MITPTALEAFYLQQSDSVSVEDFDEENDFADGENQNININSCCDHSILMS